MNVLKINTSPGPDSIHPKVLYELRDVISPYLSNFFQKSLLQGKIPSDWKMSSVTVIHKKGKKNCVENYRPISLTCITCKIMESLVRDHIMHYFKINNLFSQFQYGFITGRSVSVQLLRVLDDWTSAIDKGSQVDIVYTDFEKAFDKISHPHLIGKLYSYGINNTVVEWISYFVSHRMQRVKVNGILSDAQMVPSGDGTTG